MAGQEAAFPSCTLLESTWALTNGLPLLARAGYLHPTINVEDPEDEIDMGVIVGASKQAMDVNVALSNSFGFGGHNSSILFRAYKE